MKKVYNAMLSLLCVFTVCSCANENKDNFIEVNDTLLTETYDVIDDNYRNYYEIYVGSFYDSNGDGTGDINGVTAKLDYIKDMGFTGIWLMPIHPSPTYHKYDVMDYYDVDSAYGTVRDVKNLLAEAHKKNIDIILDLVVNHTSDQHPWFIEASNAIKNGTYSKYCDYYNFKDTFSTGYTQCGSKYYESQFVSSMPDLNLDNEEVKTEIVNIMKYWLNMGVDGFRLDTVINYYTGNTEKNIEFLSWLNTEAKAIKNDCYIVAEAWTNEMTIAEYYKSGIDSFFGFQCATKDGYIPKMLTTNQRSQLFMKMNNNYIEMAGDNIPAPFISNHDIERITSTIGNRYPKRIKFAQGILAMMNGATFDYYGDEIGLESAINDENKRRAMLWSATDLTGKCNDPVNATIKKYTFPSVEEEWDDNDSILTYYRRSMALRNKYPEIARGSVEQIDSLTDDKLLVIKKTWNNSSIYIIINFSDSEERSVDLSSLGNLSVESQLCTEGNVKYLGNVVKMPTYSIAILK